MSDRLYHPIWPTSLPSTARGHRRELDDLWHRSHGPWHNAGDPDEPACLLTPDANYMGGVGVRWRRRVGGGTEIQVAVTDGVSGDTVITLDSTWYVAGEGRIPLTGHNAGAAVAFYVDSSTGNVVIGV
jgi:hypothetical protein